MTFEPTLNNVTENYGPARLDATYRHMIELFGQPNSADDPYKTDVAWNLQDTETGDMVHVYNYKNGPNYTGEGTVEEIDSFSVQGTSISVLDNFVAFVQENA